MSLPRRRGSRDSADSGGFDRQGSAPFYRAQSYRGRWRHRWREFELIGFEKEL